MNRFENEDTMRLNRFLARAGLGSRRGVEALITAGQVTVNASVVTTPGRRIQPEHDIVVAAGQVVKLPSTWRIYAFHKPAGVISSLRPQGKKPCLAPFRERCGLSPSVMPVGRLDADTSGLLLWTDDGDLAQQLCRPASRIWKRYEVVLRAPLTEAGRQDMAEGRLSLDGRHCLPLRLALQQPDRKHWQLELHEGRNRQIRRMFALLGHTVVSLHRVGIGPLSLGRLQPGNYRRLTVQQEQRLRQAIASASSQTS
jgi:pseudouridine synthase